MSPPHALLAAAVALPPAVVVVYTRLIAAHDALDALDAARRAVLARHPPATPLPDAVLPAVHAGSLYVFKLSSSHAAVDAAALLDALPLDGLVVAERSFFTPPPADDLLPSPDQRLVLSCFYDAVRTRVIDDVAAHAAACPVKRQVKRYRGGFLMGHLAPSSDWQYKGITRPLVFCQLQIHFSYALDGTPTQLLIHPMLIPTPFLDIACALPLPAGAPITLLPYGTPAYYLASYTGPTTGLVKQFETSLQGLGAGQWATADEAHSSPYGDPTAPQQSPTFIIGWIKVENKQGEDKGITIIYPTHLCLSYVPNTSSRAPLDYIPELPAPLQPSPQVAPALPSMTRPILFSSPTSESLHSFRALTLSKTSDLRQVATEVGGYVDAVARDRERERERLKRERESGVSTSPRLARASATTPASVSAPTPSSMEASAPQSSRPLPLQPAPAIVPSVSHQNFYPSPPQGTPHAAAAPTSPATDDPMHISTMAGIVYPATDNTHPASVSTDTTPHMPTAQATPLSAVPVPPETPQPAAAYDLYGMDGAAAGYMGLDMDMAMGMDFDLGLAFGMNMGMGIEGMDDMTAPSGGGASRAGGGGGMDFDDAFTDDDFSFFDRPARAPPPPAPPTNFRIPSGGSAPGGLMSPPTTTHFEDDGVNAQQMWTPGPGLGVDAMMTPHENDPGHIHGVGPETAGGHLHALTLSTSAPATPGVHLAPPPGAGAGATVAFAHGLPTPHEGHAASLFEPIPFAAYHRRADGKYANGKFALAGAGMGLPSPPAEEVEHEYGVGVGAGDGAGYGYGYGIASLPSSPQRGARPKMGRSVSAVGPLLGTGGWRLRYDAVTDPRIGLVRKLIGVKRKPLTHGARDPQRTAPWTSVGIGSGVVTGAACGVDWETTMAIQPAVRGANDATSDAESEDEEDEEEEMGDGDDDEDEDADTPDRSRPTTPPPSYLPLGPALLPTHFAHAQLLPLSTPLRAPGAAAAALLGLPPPLAGAQGTQAPPSVPTPVSPAATAGAASERGRNLEGAARVVGAEVVTNPVWAETWRAGSVGGRAAPALWASDCRAVEALLGCVKGVTGGLGFREVFGIDSTGAGGQVLQPLEAPMISVGKGEAVINVLPTAVRFWEKLGLDPKGGRKDVAAFVLFEDEGAERQTLVESWLANLRSTYQGKHFGTVHLGTSPVCVKDGLVPLKFDVSFRKTLASFAASLTMSADSPVYALFLVLPFTVMSLSSPVFRQVISAIRRIAPNFGSHRLFFQFIPEQHLFSSLEKSSGYESALDQLTFSIYDRVMIPVDRLRSRRVDAPTTESVSIRRYFLAPSFTLARPLHNTVTYVRSVHASLDVLDRYTLLHVGYHLTACGRWIVAACVDQRGEAYETNVWLAQPPEGEGDGDGAPALAPEEYAARRVWEFGTQFAKKTNVEWRIVFARLGVMSEKELLAWSGLLATHVTASHEQPPLHHTLACVVPDAAWSFIPPKSTTAMLLSDPPRPSPQARPASLSKQAAIYTDVSAMTYSIFPTTRMPISLPSSRNDFGLGQSFVNEPASPVSSSPSSPHPRSQMQMGAAPDALYMSTQIATTPPMQMVATPGMQTVTTPGIHMVSTPAASSTSHPDAHAAFTASLPHPITILPMHSSYLIRVPNAASSSAVSITAIHLLRSFHSPVQASTPRPPDDCALLQDMTRNYYDLAVLTKVRHRLDGVGGHKGLPLHLAAVDAMRMALDREWERLEAVVET